MVFELILEAKFGEENQNLIILLKVKETLKQDQKKDIPILKVIDKEGTQPDQQDQKIKK